MPWLLRRWFSRRPLGRKIFLGLTLVWFCLWFARGWFEPLKEGANPHDAIMAQAAELSGGADLVLTTWREGHWLYARQPIVHFGFAQPDSVDRAAEWLRTHPQAFALIPSAHLERCFRADRARQLGETSRELWYLVGADAENGQCRARLPEKVYRFAWRRPLP
ncbi:hypothetical protein D3C78_1421590 [compost metagenome]